MAGLNPVEQGIWNELTATRKDLSRVKARVRRNEVSDVTQVARSVRRFADFASLPTGALGDLACTEDAGKLWFHNGTTWKEVSFV